MMRMMMMMATYLDFEVQQVAVDLVVNIGVVLLLAQIQTWDVHSGLQAQSRDRKANVIHTNTHTERTSEQTRAAKILYHQNLFQSPVKTMYDGQLNLSIA